MRYRYSPLPPRPEAAGRPGRRGGASPGRCHALRESLGPGGWLCPIPTSSRPLVITVVALQKNFTADDVLSLAASGELHARHPLAQAIVARTEERHLHIPIHQACEIVLGMGMRAELDGTRLLVGSPALLRQHARELSEVAQEWTEQLRHRGETVICLAHGED